MVKRRTADNFSFIIARESETNGSPVTDVKKAVPLQYVVTAWNHDENSEKQQSQALRGGRADVFGEDGFLWGEGDVSLEIPSGKGFLDILQGLLGDPKPVSTKLKTKKLVADTVNAADVDADTYFTDPAKRAERNPDRPSLLKFKPKGSFDAVKALVTGVRKVGLASSDTLPLKEVITFDSTKQIPSTKYFHFIDQVTFLDGNGAAMASPKGTIEILADPNAHSTVLKTVDDEFQGWTIEPNLDGEPWLVTRAVPISGTIEVGENIAAQIDLRSSRVDKRRTMGGGNVEQFTPTSSDQKKFPFIGRRFFPGYGRYLVIDGEAVICDAAPISIAHNYDFAQGKKPGRFRRGVEPTSRRNVTVNVQTKYESGTSAEDEGKYIKWDEKFRNNEPVSVQIVTYQWLGNGRQLEIIYDMTNCEITAPVRVPATSPGAIPITIALKAVPPSGETAGELKVTIVNDDKWAG